MTRLDKHATQYLETALWSTNDDSTPAGGVPMDDNYCVADIDPATVRQAIEDCRRFANEAGEMLEEHPDPTMWPHDFWLTRNGHGAGFWDGDWPINGDALTELAKTFGEVFLYVGDDGAIYS